MLSLALPESCIHCDLPVSIAPGVPARIDLARYLCPVCLRVIETEERPEDSTVLGQLGRTAPWLLVRSASALHHYDEAAPIRAIVHSFKYGGMPRLASAMGARLTPLVPQGIDCIIPVPLHRTRLATRGYNQAARLVRSIPIPSYSSAVRRVRPTETQTDLGIEERLENVRGAFALTKAASSLRGKNLLLVDDVMTTGATLASLGETVQSAGPLSISILTVAAVISGGQPTRNEQRPLHS